MARVVFFGKPTCQGNARQRALLQRSGHEVDVRDLFAEPWSAESLMSFLDALPPSAWFNRSAVRVKNGEVDPDALDASAALTLLLQEPQLLRRPLLEIDGRKLVGWDSKLLETLIGLAPDQPSLSENCARRTP